MSNPVYGKKNTNRPIVSASNQHVEHNPLITWLLLGLSALFLLWAPLWAALFNGQIVDFERPIYQAIRWTAIIAVLLSIYLFKNWRLSDGRDGFAILIFGLPLSYLISMLSAASHYQAVNQLYIYLIYAAIFIVGLYLTREKLGHSIISLTLVSSTYITVFFGLFHWFGNGKFIANLLSWLIPINPATGIYQDAVMTDSNGLRLTSFFQYANTYAAFLIAILFAGVFLVVKSKKWYVTAIHAFMLVPVILSFFLTLSRAAYVILPVVFLIIILCLKPYRQIMYTLHLGLALIASMAILNKVTELGIAVNNDFVGSESLKGWMLTLGVSIGLATIATLIQHFLTPWLERKLAAFNERKASSWYMPAIAIILGAIMVFVFIGTSAKQLLPENIKIRLENINFQQHSVLERATFYKDALKVVKDYPVFGAGGGAWYSMYEKYQNNPYISRQAHSFFFQNIVEVGIFGFLILMGLLVLFFVSYIRHYARSSEEERDPYLYYFIIAISILIHSIIDFDVSYVYIGVLLFLSLGAMLSNVRTKPLAKLSQISGVRWIFPSLVGVLAIVMFFFAQTSLNANSNYYKALNMVRTQSTTDYNTIVAPLDKALSTKPTQPDYAQLKIQLLQSVFNQTKDEQFSNAAQLLLNKTLAQEPYNFNLINVQMKQLELLGDKKSELQFVEQQLLNFPWTISLYDKAIQLNYEFGSSLPDKSAANPNYTAALAAYNKILSQKEVIASLPKEQFAGRAFDITPQINLHIAQIHYNEGDYQKVVEFAKPLLTNDYSNAINLDLTRWYLAAQQKLGATDQTIYDALIAADPDEKATIEAIAAGAK